MYGSYRTPRPRTIASAVASVATRNPSRPSSACRTASLTSWVSAGSGVSLSNGRIATVLTLGSVPPAKPYGQAASTTPEALTASAPNIRRNERRRIDHADRELKSGRGLGKVDARARGAPQCVELGTAPRHHCSTPPPFGLQQGLPARAVGHDVVEGILGLREAPDDAALVRQRVQCPSAEHRGILRRRPHHRERRPQHRNRGNQGAEILFRIRPC